MTVMRMQSVLTLLVVTTVPADRGFMAMDPSVVSQCYRTTDTESNAHFLAFKSCSIRSSTMVTIL